MTAGIATRVNIGGHVAPGFEAVLEEFAANLERRGELGGACCAFFTVTAGPIKRRAKRSMFGAWVRTRRLRP